jgi:hypothetical protein
MSNSGGSLKWNAIREIAAGSLTASYQDLGGVFLQDAYRLWFTNNTNGDAYFSNDGFTNMIKMPAFTGRAYDNKTNDAFCKSGTQWQVKFDSVPGSPVGWVGLEVEFV